MGVAGYYDMKPIWDQEDKEEVAAGGKPTFSEIRGEHARDYLWERARRRDEKRYRVMLKASQIPGRFYMNLGPCDIMFDALETR